MHAANVSPAAGPSSGPAAGTGPAGTADPDSPRSRRVEPAWLTRRCSRPTRRPPSDRPPPTSA